jgi:thiamine kinase-like enzyme
MSTNPYRNNPNKVLPVRVRKEDDEGTLYASINAMLLQLTQQTDSDVSYSLKPLTGGITNVLYRATPSNGSEEFVVRFFGDGTEIFIDRTVENNVFASLSQAGLAPAFVGLFENGRVEGMLDCHNLSCDDMVNPVLIPHIAKSVAILHKQNVDMDRNVDIWSKLDQFFQMAVGKTITTEWFSNAVFTLMYISFFVYIDAFDAGKLKGRGGDVKKMRDESIWLKEKMEQLHNDARSTSDDASVFEFQKGCQFAFEKVMAHNDLLSGNILINNDYDGSADPSLTIIDYEYTCYNARAFDIGNHFCGEWISRSIAYLSISADLWTNSSFKLEYAGFDFDIRNLFPNEETRHVYFRNYVAEANGCSPSDVSPQFLKGLDVRFGKRLSFLPSSTP